ncbi:choice-of-anchor E domain-containing protein, partial [Patescibacteria group bacterium]|nr:choice-of-anchor E domain-containing protein [Patescibacteria group bacterium]
MIIVMWLFFAHTSRNKSSLMIIALLVVLLIPSGAKAQSVTHTVSLPIKETNWSEPIAIPQFDTTSGSLATIDMTMVSTISGSVQIENLDASATNVKSTLSALMKIKKPNGIAMMEFTPEVVSNDTFGAFDGVIDYKGNSGNTNYLKSTSTGTDLLTSITAEDAEFFEGDGTVTLEVSTEGTSQFIGAGNLESISNLEASAYITFVYTRQRPDLTINISTDGDFTIGEEEKITLTVGNGGTGPTIDDVTVTGTLPSGITPLSGTGAGWNCSFAGQAITCTTSSTLNKNSSLPVITIKADVDTNAFPAVSFSSNVSSYDDSDTSNDTDTVNITVVEAPPPDDDNDDDGSGGGGGGGG